MKIAIDLSPGEYTDAMFERLRRELPDDIVVRAPSAGSSSTEEIEVLLAMNPVTRALLQTLPRLGLIHTLSDGYEHVDMAAATEMGVWVSNSPGDVTGNSDSVAEFAVLLLLAAARRLGVIMASTRDRSACKTGLSPSLARKVVCLVGPGSIGAKIAHRLQPFGVRLIAVDWKPLYAPQDIETRPLDQLKATVAEADFVVISVRATSETTHMFDADVLAAMKQGAVLVNIARGSLIDETALRAAVKSGHLRGAGLDVLEYEPMRPDEPLLTLPEVFVTPHLAGQTDLTLEGTVKYAIEVMARFKAGVQMHSVLNAPKSPRRVLAGARQS
jgi:phosphoglycerate dehydrogenase-like enzyme